jgi:hypothetical protein
MISLVSTVLELDLENGPEQDIISFDHSYT